MNNTILIIIIMSRNYDYLFKLLFVGDSGVGKTSILLRYTDDNFTTSFISTIGIDFKIKTIEINNKIIKLQIWDTTGQERFKTITSAYYRGAMGIIYVYDITNQQSFNHIETWIKSTKEITDDNIKLIIGNKCDLESQRIISPEQGIQLAKEYDTLFYEVSAKENININESIYKISEKIKNKLDNIECNSLQKQQPINVDIKPSTKKKSFCQLI